MTNGIPVESLFSFPENLENARTHVAKEVEAADHNQHIMAKLLEQSEFICRPVRFDSSLSLRLLLDILSLLLLHDIHSRYGFSCWKATWVGEWGVGIRHIPHEGIFHLRQLLGLLGK